jgi:hypothetical protein
MLCYVSFEKHQFKAHEINHIAEIPWMKFKQSWGDMNQT